MLYIYIYTKVVEIVLSLTHILDLSHISHLYMDPTTTKISSEIRISFSCFINIDSTLPKQRCLAMPPLSEWSLETFEGSSYIYIYIYIMNRSANEFECGTLGFYFIKLCCTRVSDFIVFFRRLMMLRAVFSGFYRKDYFNRVVILFSSRICVCDRPVGVYCPRKTLASADVFLKIHINKMFSVSECGNLYTRTYIHVYTPIHTYISGLLFFLVSLFLPELKVR